VLRNVQDAGGLMYIHTLLRHSPSHDDATKNLFLVLDRLRILWWFMIISHVNIWLFHWCGFNEKNWKDRNHDN